MSEDVGYKKPPKRTRFKPGVSGNPRGRPRKAQRDLLPRQFRKDVLVLASEEIMVETPTGPKKMNATVLFLRTVRQRAIAGNPTAMKMWKELTTSALQGRMDANGIIRLLDSFADDENRGRARLHEIESDPDYDLRKATKDIY